jgi:hypothetical protein
MPYVPPHLRPGYVSTPIVKPDFRGKVHWPTDVDKDTNIVEASKPHLGIVAAKSALKITKPITLNNTPLAKPSMRLGHSKFNHAVRRHISRKFRSKKILRRHSVTRGKKRQTRKKRTY